MAYFVHAFQKMLVGTGGFVSTAAGPKTTTLTPGQIGLVDNKTHRLVNIAGTADYRTTPLVYLAQGSFHPNDKLGGSFHGGYQETVKSKGINPKYVSRFYVVEPAEPQNHIIHIGPDVYTTLPCNKTYHLRVDVKGSPALRFLTHNLYHTFDASTGCCAPGENPPPVGVEVVLQGWVDQINSEPLVTPFIQAELVYFVRDTSVASPTEGELIVNAGGKDATFDAAADADKTVKIELTSAYVDTVFGDCSFDPKDHFEREPLQIYASEVDEDGDPCTSVFSSVEEIQEAKQGNGFGETIVRELILFKRYLQEPWLNDVRMREVEQVTTLDDITRGSKYTVYHILHSIPRNTNPSGVFDSDQYLIKIVVSARSTAFETYLEGLLESAGSAVTLEVF